MCLVIAGSIDQARTVFGYVRGFLEAAPALAKEVVASTQSEVTLRNGIVIGVHSNSFRTVRGRTLVACVMDEVSFWRDESSATPDIETYRAVLPSLATTNGMLIGISTPYRKLGLLHQKHRDHFGVDGDDVLVVQGASKTFNPSLSDGAIAAQRAADPAVATMTSVSAQQIGNLQGQPSNALSTPGTGETNARQSSSSRYCVQRCFRQGFAPP